MSKANEVFFLTDAKVTNSCVEYYFWEHIMMKNVEKNL